MKLYSVMVWCQFDEETWSTEMVIAESIKQAEEKSIENEYYDSAKATEITVVDGYKVNIEKI